MSDRILERSAIALERFVTGFTTSRYVDGIAEAPVPWSCHAVRFNPSEVPGLIRETRNVLQAIALFAETAPAWAIPLPVGDEISPLLRADSGPLCLLGSYACSLMMMSYDYRGHPSFHAYSCGVMAHQRAPNHVRDDPELRAEFPAKELPGLSGRLVWFGERLPPQVRAEVLGR
jgi:hypothetical protein